MAIVIEEKSFDSRGRAVKSVTEEVVGDSVNALSPPNKAKNTRIRVQDRKVTMTYDLPPDDGNLDTAQIAGTTSQEPLATHPHFRTGGKWAVSAVEWKVWDKWQKEGTDIAAEDLTSYSEGFQKFVTLYLAGFTDFLQASVTYSYTDVDSRRPSLGDLGKITQPFGAPPPLRRGGNWLLVGVNAVVDVEGRWDTTYEYRASGEGGWNRDIY
jgi:hypothetical protein